MDGAALAPTANGVIECRSFIRSSRPAACRSPKQWHFTSSLSRLWRSSLDAVPGTRPRSPDDGFPLRTFQRSQRTNTWEAKRAPNVMRRSSKRKAARGTGMRCDLWTSKAWERSLLLLDRSTGRHFLSRLQGTGLHSVSREARCTVLTWRLDLARPPWRSPQCWTTIPWPKRDSTTIHDQNDGLSPRAILACRPIVWASRPKALLQGTVSPVIPSPPLSIR